MIENNKNTKKYSKQKYQNQDMPGFLTLLRGLTCPLTNFLVT